MSYSGYQYATDQSGYDQASYSQSQPVYDTSAQYSAADQTNQYTSGANASSYDYSYSTEYYSQNQASQPSDYNQQSQMSYSQPPAPSPDSYYSYSANTAQPPHSQQAQSYQSTGNVQTSSYSGVQPMTGYEAQYQQAPQQQQFYQSVPQNQQQQFQPLQHNQQVYQEQQPTGSQYQATQLQSQGYENQVPSSDVYGINSAQSSMGGYSNPNNISDGTWTADGQYMDSTVYYQSEAASRDQSYPQDRAGFAPSNVDPGVDSRGGFSSYSGNSGGFSSYSHDNFSTSGSNGGYVNDSVRPRTNQPDGNSTDYGGYSGPAPSTRGSWRRPTENSRGGARGRSGFHQNSRGSSFGSRSAGTWAAPPQRQNDKGSWREGGNFQSGPSYGGRKKFGNPESQSSSHEGRPGFNRGRGGFSLSSSRGRMQPSAYTSPQPARPVVDDGPAFETQKPYKKPEGIKAPSRPQDRLLNEVKEREKAKAAEKKKPPTPEEKKKMEEEKKKAEEDAKKKAEEERKKAEEDRKKAEEEAKKRAEEEKKKADQEKMKAAEELRKKLADEAVKAAPPSKPPETAEEIAYEEEIKRKIRESVVVLTSAVEDPPAPVKADPVEELKMSEELRELLKSLTTQYLCKLCSVRIVGSQMAGMHYNGKNHLKKLRNFVQTNGRSAGFYLGGVKEQKAKDTKDDEEKDGENKAEAVENTEVDENKYCKICKVNFSQSSQAEMHYKGKNHAKKLKATGGADGTGPEVFECKICCVTVTAQEHLTAHLNGARHKLQVRKIDANENYSGSVPNRGRGGLGYRGRGGRGGGSDWKPGSDGGRGGLRGRGRGDFKGRGGHDQAKKSSLIDYTDEELLNLFSIEPSKKFCFDLANYRTPSGSFYCCSCDVAMMEEPQFLLHLGTRKHRDKVLGKKKKPRKTILTSALKESMNISRRD